MLINQDILVNDDGVLFLYNDSNGFAKNLVNRTIDYSKLRLNSHLSDLNKSLKSKGVDFFLFVFPDKFFELNNTISDGLMFNPIEIEKFRPAANLTRLDFVDFFQLSKFDGKLGAYYYDGDSHFNALGGLTFSKYVCETIDLVLPDRYWINIDNQIISTPFGGDLFDRLLDSEKNTLHQFCLNHGLEKYPRVQKFLDVSVIQSDSSFAHAIRTGVHSDNEYKVNNFSDSRRCLLFRQSTGIYLEKIFAESFKETRSHYSNGVVDLSVVDDFSPDIVVHAISERFVSRYFEFN